MSRQSGAIYEQQAADFLIAQGLRILYRNVQILRGEIDLIAEDDGTLVFTEVKFRQRPHFGHPCEMLSLKKQQLISRTAALFLQRKPQYQTLPCRFDLIAISGRPYKLDWIKSAFLIT